MSQEGITNRTQPGQIPDLSLADTHSFPVLHRKANTTSQSACADFSGKELHIPFCAWTVTMERFWANKYVLQNNQLAAATAWTRSGWLQ